MPSVCVVTEYFDKKRSLALGIASSGRCSTKRDIVNFVHLISSISNRWKFSKFCHFQVSVNSNQLRVSFKMGVYEKEKL